MCGRGVSRIAGVVELVDTPDLGSGGESFGGSSPSARTSSATAPFRVGICRVGICRN
jgi:hypothetical protein